MPPKTLRVSFLTQTDDQGASARLRVYALLPYLRELGLNCQVFPANTEASTLGYLSSALRRLRERHHIAARSDVIVIQRDLINHLKPWLERAYARTGVPLVFDIDDAIDLRPPGFPPTWRSRLFGCHDKIERLASLAAHMVLGNEVLADRVRPINERLTVLPTALDLSLYPAPAPRSLPQDRALVIGWIGSPLTTPYLDLIRPALRDLSFDYLFRTVGAAPLDWPEIKLDQRAWVKGQADAEVRGFDIGVMPLSDDPWSRAKCGTKIIQYFVEGIPTVASPVGMNRFALDDGQAGWLAEDSEDWRRAFESLASDAELYANYSKAGRLRAEQHFDVRLQAKQWKDLLEKVVEEEG